MALLNGKTAIVTGAASGIGRRIALLYAREGARVVVSDFNVDDGEETSRMIRDAGGEAVFVQTDVTEPASCEMLVNKTLETYGRLDVACNNAGIGGEQAPAGDYAVEAWRRVIDVNLSGVFYCMKYQIAAMLKSGGGAIVNMASILGQVGFANSVAYVAAKHGVVGMTKTAGIEYSARGIRVNAVGPAFIRTPMIQALEQDQQTYKFLLDQHPIGRLGEPDEVAELVVWLSSDKASFVAGAYYPVDGGYLAH
ncbi:MAG: glucose 1-dehydrogenase [Thiohalomonadaceae bacterium]